MLERAREHGRLREAAILVAALALAGGIFWLLSDRGGSEPTAEQARSSAPAPAGLAAPSTDREGSEAGSDRESDPKHQRGARGRDDRRGPEEPAHRGRAEPSGPATAESPQPGRKDVDEIVENLLGGKPDRSPSQADLPPELGALLQGSDDPEPSKPSPTLEELLEEASGGG